MRREEGASSSRSVTQSPWKNHLTEMKVNYCKTNEVPYSSPKYFPYHRHCSKLQINIKYKLLNLSKFIYYLNVR